MPVDPIQLLDAESSTFDFIAPMEALDLPRPKPIDVALPANRRPGLPQTA